MLVRQLQEHFVMKVLGENNCSLGIARLRRGSGEVFDMKGTGIDVYN